MQKLTLLITFSILISLGLKAQGIKAYKTFGGVRFENDTTELSMNQVMSILKENDQAYAEIKKAKSYSNAAAITGFTGAMLLAFPLGTAVAGGEPEWIMAAGGAALLITSIPLNGAYRNHTMNALDLYNENKTARIKSEFIWFGTGAKLILRF